MGGTETGLELGLWEGRKDVVWSLHQSKQRGFFIIPKAACTAAALVVCAHSPEPC